MGFKAATLEKRGVKQSLTVVVHFETTTVAESIQRRERRRKKRAGVEAQFQKTHSISNGIHDWAYSWECNYCYWGKPIMRLAISPLLEFLHLYLPHGGHVSSARSLFT